jgi:pyruvate,water dikinase
MGQARDGDVLVADMTDPDWEPVMKRASAIVTNRGGRTCHAAIIARELGIPAVVGCGDATHLLKRWRFGDGVLCRGRQGWCTTASSTSNSSESNSPTLPPLPVKIMMNVGNPDRAFDFASLPNRGVGLARLEFIINRMIGVHPKAILLDFARLPPDLKNRSAGTCRGLRRSGRVFRVASRRRHQHHRRGVRAQAGDRPPV